MEPVYVDTDVPFATLAIITPVSAPLACRFRATLLAGCASQAPMDDSGRQAGQWERQQAEVEAFDTWTLIGKAGLRTPEENVSANLDWNQTPYYFRMLISGPFGGGRKRARGSRGALLPLQ